MMPLESGEMLPIDWFGIILNSNPSHPVIMAAVVDSTQWEEVEPQMSALIDTIVLIDESVGVLSTLEP